MHHIFFKLILLFAIIICQHNLIAQPIHYADAFESQVGASRMELYINLLNNKKVGIVANQSSCFNGTHLVDTLLRSGINIIKIFTPEHGFRGTEAEGANISNEIDSKTGLPIISLYGKNKKPSNEQLAGIDILLFDLQDVGVRFYTYISTLSYIMEACAQNNIPVIVLDRPNPNGFYIDGPVLEQKYQSFVGLHKVPIVYGMTIGEYAQMVNGEKWLADGLQCSLTVIPMGNYNRNFIYKLPIKPSPNLPNAQSVYLYPSLCFFEGTIISVGRGTSIPFQCFGHPDMNGDFQFVPQNSGNYKAQYAGKTCKGTNLSTYKMKCCSSKELHLEWLIEAYQQIGNRADFFNNYFNKLAGNDILQQQIKQGLSENEIRKSWQNDLEAFKAIRQRYLIYP